MAKRSSSEAGSLRIAKRYALGRSGAEHRGICAGEALIQVAIVTGDGNGLSDSSADMLGIYSGGVVIVYAEYRSCFGSLEP